jgi:predicted nucleic acid-binding protein
LSKVVVDASVTLAWCFPDDANRYADAVLVALAAHQLVEPAIWGMEIANAILVGERRARIHEPEIERFIELLDSLNVIEDVRCLSEVLVDVLSLARKNGIAVYDAAYLEAAIRHEAPLATVDRALERAARSIGVPSFEP